jgi:hypothetical protein
VLFFKRPYDRARVGRHELRRIGDHNPKHNLERVIVRPLCNEDVGPSARMAQAARVVISLEFELVAEVLPKGDRTAPIVRLDKDTVDAVRYGENRASS